MARGLVDRGVSLPVSGAALVSSDMDSGEMLASRPKAVPMSPKSVDGVERDGRRSAMETNQVNPRGSFMSTLLNAEP
jgi:hypothetical protein